MKLRRFGGKRLRRQLPSSGRDWQMFGTGLAVVVVFILIGTLISHSRVPLKPESDKITISWLPSTVKRWQGPINEAAKKYNVDPNLVAIIMTLESGGYAKAGSSADAHGLMQITPPTAKEIAKKYL